MSKFRFITSKEELKYTPKFKIIPTRNGINIMEHVPFLTKFILKIDRYTGEQEWAVIPPCITDFELDLGKKYYIEFEAGSGLIMIDYDLSSLRLPIYKTELNMLLEKYIN